LPRERRNGLDVGDAQQRIAGRFDPDQMGGRRQRLLQCPGHPEVHELDRQFATLLPRGEQPEGATVAVVRCDDPGADGQQVPDQRDGAHAGAGDHGTGAALQIRYRIAQQVAGGVTRA